MIPLSQDEMRGGIIVEISHAPRDSAKHCIFLLGTLGPVYMRRGRSQTSTNNEICIMFTFRDQNEIIPGRSRPGHNSSHSRYLHESGTKTTQTGLKSSCRLDRDKYVQAEMKFI